MPDYTFTFKQKDISLEFFTTDVEFIQREMEKWINSISEKKSNKFINEKKDNNEQIIEPIKPKETVAKNEIPHEKNEIKESTIKTDFSEIIQERIESSAVNSIKEKKENNSGIKEFIKNKKPELLVDYLICATYYLSEVAKLDRFSLKQINSEIVKLINKPVDHSIIQQAVNKDYIRVMPDFTGMADVTEYSMTESGEEYFINEL